MRYVASSLLLAWLSFNVASPVHAESRGAAPEPAVELTPTDVALQKANGVLEETPNQRRIRLGQPIEASYPPPEYGELLETPNQRRARLNQPMSEAETASIQQ